MGVVDQPDSRFGRWLAEPMRANRSVYIKVALAAALINLFGIGAAGLMQMATGRLHGAIAPNPAAAPYAALFAAYATLTALGLIAYLWSQDRTD